MTAPTSSGPPATIAYPVTGTSPAPIGPPGQPPVGCQLVNRGDNGATVWLQAGPVGAAVPLGPGGSITWADPSTMPYAYLSAAGAETILVTNQAGAYSNPAAVAAATALSIATRGVPSVFTDAGVGVYQITPGQTSAAIDVSGYSSLSVMVAWTFVGRQPGAMRLRFTAPNARPVGVSPTQDVYLTHDATYSGNGFEPAGNVWRVPCLGPSLTLTNITAAGASPADVNIMGSNRPQVVVEQVGDQLGARNLFATCPVAGAYVPLYLSNSVTNNAAGSSLTRFGGPVQLACDIAGGAGYLLGSYVDQTGTVVLFRLRVTGPGVVIPWTHPRVPVSWSFAPDTAIAGNYMRLTVTG